MSYAPYLTFMAALWLACNTFFCAILWKRYKNGVDPRVLALMKRFGELEIELADMRDLYERLMTSHKRLRSSAGMAKLRGIKDNEAQDDLKTASEAEILRRMNINRRPNQ